MRHGKVRREEQTHHVRDIEEACNESNEPRRWQRLDKDDAAHVEVRRQRVQQLRHRRLGHNVDVRVYTTVKVEGSVPPPVVNRRHGRTAQREHVWVGRPTFGSTGGSLGRWVGRCVSRWVGRCKGDGSVPISLGRSVGVGGVRAHV